MNVWPEEDIRDLRVLWASGLPTAEIGEKLGYSKNAICGKAHRLDLDARPSPINIGGRAAIAALRAPKTPKVTLPPLVSAEPPPVVELILIELIQAVATVPDPRPVLSKEERDRQILLHGDLSSNRCAKVVGVTRDIVRAVRAKQRRDEFKIVPTDVLTERPDPPKPVIIAPPPVQVQPCRLPTLSCCWPTGTRTSVLSTFGCCGDRAVPGKPYCEEHAKLAYVRVRDRKEDVA